MVRQHDAGNIHSIDRVRSELLAGSRTEDLVVWVKNDLPADFFLETDSSDVIAAYEDVMLWVQRNPQYYDRAKAKFATEADGWLVAFAMARGGLVVTNEQPRPESRNRILLPDVCTRFNVAYRDTFSMLRHLSIRFESLPPN